MTLLQRKFEARNPKFETNPKSKCSNVQNKMFGLWLKVILAPNVWVI